MRFLAGCLKTVKTANLEEEFLLSIEFCECLLEDFIDIGFI